MNPRIIKILPPTLVFKVKNIDIAKDPQLCGSKPNIFQYTHVLVQKFLFFNWTSTKMKFKVFNTCAKSCKLSLRAGILRIFWNRIFQDMKRSWKNVHGNKYKLRNSRLANTADHHRPVGSISIFELQLFNDLFTNRKPHLIHVKLETLPNFLWIIVF